MGGVFDKLNVKFESRTKSENCSFNTQSSCLLKISLGECLVNKVSKSQVKNKVFFDRRRFKGEGHSRNGVFSEIANKKITLSSVTDRGFSF